MEDGTASTALHDLLLTLAGRVDDDLLAWARELVAVEEDTRAVELLVASLVADRAVLPPDVRAGLVAAALTARIELDADAALLPSGIGDTGHRFDPGPAGDAVTTALHALPARQLRGCRVLVARRLTPAGSAPGPLPHPVVIIEVEPDGRPTAVLAYQVGVALERAGVLASVEVLTAGAPVPDYHAAALRSARPLSDDGRAGSPVPEPAGPVEPFPPTAPSEPPPAFVENGTVAPARLPLRSVEPPPADPVPTEPASDLFAVSPLAGSGSWSEPGSDDAMPQRVRRPTVTSIARRAPAAPVDEAPDQAPDEAPEPEQSEASWSGEWLSGAWTMSTSTVEEPELPTPQPSDPHPPRHRFLGEPDDHGSDDDAGEPDPPAPEDGDPGPAPTALGLRPEALARMSEENRDLLARLRAELSAGPSVADGPNDTGNGSG